MSGTANIGQSGVHVSNAQPQTYNKRHGTSGINGQLYEISLVMLALLHGESLTKDGALKSFQLASNMDEADAFDDVVFQCKHAGVQAKNQVIFLQAKHKDVVNASKYLIKFNTLEQKNSDVYLPKYFAAYLRVKKQFLTSHVNDSFFNNFRDVEFIIYTNALLDENSEQHFNKINVDSKSMWNINSNNCYFQLDFNRNNKKLVDILKYSLDCGQLARELAQCIASGSDIETKNHNFEKYRYSLKTQVFQSNKFNNDFVDGYSLSPEERIFRNSLIDELEKIPMFIKKSRTEIVSELKTMSFNISNPIKQSSPGVALPSDSVQDADIQEFLSKLKFFFGQPNVNLLNEIIKLKLKSLYGLDSSDINIIFNWVQCKIETWWGNKNKVNDFLTENNKIFEEAKQNLAKLKLVGLALSLNVKIMKLGLEFESNKLDIFKDEIRNQTIQILNIVANETTLLLNQTVLYQSFESMAEYKSDNSDPRYIFMSLSDVLNLQTNVIDAFKTKECNLIAIDCDTNDENQNLYNQLSSIIREYQSKIIVLLAEDTNWLARTFKMKYQTTGIYKEISCSSFDFSDLTLKSQREILEKNIIFQGERVKLKEVIVDTATHLLTAEVLSLLINNIEIYIGTALSTLGDVENVYIERILELRNTIGRECFKKDCPDWFAFSSIEEQELSRLTDSQSVRKLSNKSTKVQHSKYIILDNESTKTEDYEHLCSINSEKNIHWLKKQNYEFIWLKTRGALSNIRAFFKSNIVKEYQINAIHDRFVILTSEPGMGKSTFITKLSQNKDFISCWVIRINLGEHTDQLNASDFNAINFLSDAAGLTTSLEKNLFRLRLNTQGNILIYVDGFDEISPTYKDKVLQLLTVLQDTKAERVLVTTRENMASILEDGLSLLSYKLKPLSTGEQKEFLRKFWSSSIKKQVPILKEDRLDKYINKLIETLSQSMSNPEKPFIGIPLQTRMIAEVFDKKCTAFHNSDQDDPDIPSYLDLFSLYKQFIDIKISIYSQEKLKHCQSNPAVTDELDNIQKSVVIGHGLLALAVFLSDQELKGILSKRDRNNLKTLTDNIKEGKERTGIISQISNDKAVFIHRTFAEYFAASWLATYMDEEEVKDLLRKKLFEEEFKVIRFIFDWFMCYHEENKTILKKIDKHYAIQHSVLNRDISTLKDLLSIGIDINSIDKVGRTALHLAVTYRYSDMVEILLAHNALVNSADTIFNCTPLANVDRNKDWHLAEMLLQRGASGDDMIQALSNIGKQYGHGNTLLHIAAEKGYTKLAEILVHKGADVNVVNYMNDTPLHLAIYNGQLELTKLLVSHNADIVTSRKYNKTPLHYAVLRNHIEIVQYLIESNADIEARDDNNQTVLHYAARRNYIKIVQCLVAHKAVIDARDINNWTPLHHAAEKCNNEIVQLLIKHNADINARDIHNQTSLHHAASKNNTEIVQCLIELNADINARDIYNQAPLHHAAHMNCIETFQYLVGQNAEIEARDNFNRTSLHLAVRQNNIEIIQCLLEHNADIEARDGDYWTPLNLATERNYFKIVQYLVEHNANIGVRDKNKQTPLHRASIWNHLETVQCLVEHNADINVQDKWNLTPLHYAASNNNIELIQYLVEHGAGIYVADIEGRTLLDLVINNGHIYTYNLLNDQ